MKNIISRRKYINLFILFCSSLSISKILGLLFSKATYARGNIQRTYFKGNDDGRYYVTVYDKEYFWYGEHPDLVFCNLFFGRLENGIVSGKYFDLPKGKTNSHGELSFRSIVNGFERVSRIGNFGASKWEKVFSKDKSASSKTPGIGFQENGSKLTGIWLGTNGDTYYVREVGDNVVWYAESENAGHENLRHQGYSQAFVGKRIDYPFGTAIQGNKVIIPKGKISNAVRKPSPLNMALREDHTLIEVGDRSINLFGDSHLDSYKIYKTFTTEVVIRLNTLEVITGSDIVGGTDVKIYACFFKIDGDSVLVTDLNSSFATVDFRTRPPGKNTIWNVNEGEVIRLPEEIFRYSTVLKTIRGVSPWSTKSRTDTKVGVIVTGFDTDGNSSFENKHLGKIRNRFKITLDEMVKNGGFYSRDFNAKISRFSYEWITILRSLDLDRQENFDTRTENPDDFLGGDSIVFNLSNLLPDTKFELVTRTSREPGSREYYKIRGEAIIVRR